MFTNLNLLNNSIVQVTIPVVHSLVIEYLESFSNCSYKDN